MNNYKYRTWQGRSWGKWVEARPWTVESMIAVYSEALFPITAWRHPKLGLIWRTRTPSGILYSEFIFEQPDMLTQELLALKLKEEK